MTGGVLSRVARSGVVLVVARGAGGAWAEEIAGATALDTRMRRTPAARPKLERIKGVRRILWNEGLQDDSWGCQGQRCSTLT